VEIANEGTKAKRQAKLAVINRSLIGAWFASDGSIGQVQARVGKNLLVKFDAEPTARFVPIRDISGPCVAWAATREGLVLP
jgi:hypothetical protein